MVLQITRIDIALSAQVFATSSCVTECLGTTTQGRIVGQHTMLNCCKGQSIDEEERRDMLSLWRQHVESMAGTCDTVNRALFLFRPYVFAILHHVAILINAVEKGGMHLWLVLTFDITGTA